MSAISSSPVIPPIVVANGTVEINNLSSHAEIPIDKNKVV